MESLAAVVGGGIGGIGAAMVLCAGGRHVDARGRVGALPGAGTALALWPFALRTLDILGAGGRPCAGGEVAALRA